MLSRTRAALEAGALAERDDAIGQLARSLRALRDDEAGLSALLREFASLRNKLPAEAREGDDAIRLDDPAFLREALDDVEHTLISAAARRERRALKVGRAPAARPRSDAAA